ncbi:universal stress protein [Streptomyces phaeochromogenes]|uniref:universal stress protein n=1 Tax=Streptomyces phaeochromogenes TaxID=1923 RepID=UPI0027D88607|nr:universal stress protein [Streptomyces phaeochromogenes]
MRACPAHRSIGRDGHDHPPCDRRRGIVAPEFDAELTAQVRHELSDVLRSWRTKFPGVEVHEQTVIGGAGSNLVDASRDAALVVVGRRTRHAQFGTHIGPVTHAVLHHATAPVAVVPHD